MIDQIFCFFFCAKVISHQVIYQQPYIAKTEEIQEEDEPDSTKLPKGASINDGTNAKEEQKGIWKAGKTIRGYVSHYSAKWGACLGCSPHYDSKGQLYYITANGDRLDDDRLTIASNDFPLGTMVSICNLDNLKCTTALVNDTGGFNTPKYNNRIADLVPAVQKALGTVTDKTLVEISEIPKVAEK